jgi:hypothetical protein
LGGSEVNKRLLGAWMWAVFMAVCLELTLGPVSLNLRFGHVP